MKRTITTIFACAALVAPAIAESELVANGTPLTLTASPTSGSLFGSAFLSSSGGLLLAGTETYTNGTYKRSGQSENLTTVSNFQSYESIQFIENVLASDSSSVYGGAIYSDALTFTDNGDITFNKNTASTTGYTRGGYGGAIYASTLTFSNNGDITFNENTVGASYIETTTVSIGGAINGSSSFNGNGNITFSRNKAISRSVAYGGAVSGNLTFTGNGDITFSENTASSRPSEVHGGAISGGATFSDNGNITISGNTGSGTGINSHVYGGAIYVGGSSQISFTDNGDITFSGNTASSTGVFSYPSASAYGGAIYAYYKSTLTFTGNGDITFSGNTASSGSSTAYGGAICIRDTTLTIHGSALFKKNAEISSGIYRLRSIYQDSGSLELSAPTEKSIEFQDGIYSTANTVVLNCNYTLSDGSTQTANGIIRFTGKYTADDLADVKGRVATANELQNSLTSTITGTVQLMGGTLSVEDGATLDVGGISMTSSSGIVVKDATLAAKSGTITTVSGASITTQGCSTLSFGTLVLTQAITNTGTLTLGGNINADALALVSAGATHIDVDGLSGDSGFAKGANYEVKLVEGGTTIDNGVTVTHGQHTLALKSNGVATAGGTIDYSNYLLTGTDRVSVSAIHAVSSAESAVITQTGGTLTMDADAVLSATGGTQVFQSATVTGEIVTSNLTVAGHSSINGNLTLSDGAILSMEVGEDERNTALLNLTGTLSSGMLTLDFATDSLVSGHTYKLLSLADASAYNAEAWKAGNVTLSDTKSSFDDLAWEDGCLTFTYNPYAADIDDHHDGTQHDETSTEIVDHGYVHYDHNHQDGDGSEHGGAFDAHGHELDFRHNREVRFNGNVVQGDGGAHGGAIYSDNKLSFSDNKSVVFQGNAEINGSEYRLRSIYSEGTEEAPAELNLTTTNAGHSIEFRDSIYADEHTVTKLNESGAGTITFTGESTEADLQSVAGRAGTEAEIKASRTSELHGDTTLYGGHLVIMENAILNIDRLSVEGGQITVATGAQLNLGKTDITLPTLTLGGGSVTLGTENDHAATLTTSALTITDSSVINADLVVADHGSLTFRFSGDISKRLTMGCSLTLGEGVSVYLDSETISLLEGSNATDITLVDDVEDLPDILLSDCVRVYSEETGDTVEHFLYTSTDGTSGKKSLNVSTTPEPATATFSLLALAGLAVRRRRH